MSFTIRPFTDADYPALARILSEVNEEVIAAETLRSDDERRPAKCKHGEWVAEQDDEMVGMGYYNQLAAFYHPQKFEVGVTVLPKYRRQGIGTALWRQVEEALAPFDPVSLNTGIKETWTDAIRFAESRGFVEKLRNWESHLDVQRFDLAAWQPYVAEAEAKGYTMVPLRELMADPDWPQKLYKMVMEVRLDVPTTDPWQETSFEDWFRVFDGNPQQYPEAYYIGIHNGEWVGLSALWKSDEEGVLTTGLTAIKRPHRGTGIAKALKVKAIGAARAAGYRLIKTWNESNNVRMLAINTKMGFVRQPAWVFFKKQVKAEE